MVVWNIVVRRLRLVNNSVTLNQGKGGQQAKHKKNLPRGIYLICVHHLQHSEALPGSEESFTKLLHAGKESPFSEFLFYLVSGHKCDAISLHMVRTEVHVPVSLP